MASKAHRRSPTKAQAVFGAMRNDPRCWRCGVGLRSARQGRTQRGQICTKCKQVRSKCPGCGGVVRLGKLVYPQCEDIDIDKDVFWVCRWCDWSGGGRYFVAPAPQGSSNRFSQKIHVKERGTHAKDCRA